MLRDAGWMVNVKRVERILAVGGAQEFHKSSRREAGRWLNDGSWIRLRQEYPELRVRRVDFVEDRNRTGKKYRRCRHYHIIDEFTLRTPAR